MITASKKIKSTDTFVIEGDHKFEQHHAEVTIRELDMPVFHGNSVIKLSYAVGIETWSKYKERAEYVETPRLFDSLVDAKHRFEVEQAFLKHRKDVELIQFEGDLA